MNKTIIKKSVIYSQSYIHHKFRKFAAYFLMFHGISVLQLVLIREIIMLEQQENEEISRGTVVVVQMGLNPCGLT